MVAEIGPKTSAQELVPAIAPLTVAGSKTEPLKMLAYASDTADQVSPSTVPGAAKKYPYSDSSWVLPSTTSTAPMTSASRTASTVTVTVLAVVIRSQIRLIRSPPPSADRYLPGPRRAAAWPGSGPGRSPRSGRPARGSRPVRWRPAGPRRPDRAPAPPARG